MTYDDEQELKKNYARRRTLAIRPPIAVPRPPFEGDSMRQLFLIYDERAMLEGTHRAVVLCTAKTLAEARHDVQTMFERGVIYRYDTQGDELVNETFIEGPS